MKFAVSAALSVILLAGYTGCCCNRPRCGHGCDDCGVSDCGSCDSGCGGMGCGARYWGDWPSGCEPCDQCANWTGPSQTSPSYATEGYGHGGGYRRNSNYFETAMQSERPTRVASRAPRSSRTERAEPGSYKVTTRSQGFTDAEGRPHPAPRQVVRSTQVRTR